MKQSQLILKGVHLKFVWAFIAMMLISLFPNFASASQGTKANKSGGIIYDTQTYIRDHVCFRFHGNGTAEVVGYDLEIYGYEYKHDEFYHGDVVIPETVYYEEGGSPFTVTTIHESAFINSKLLESITLPATVTKIPDFAFAYCEKLTTVNYPESITEICKNAFMGCKALVTAEIPNQIQTIGERVFEDCTNLTNVKIGSGLTTMGETPFFKCPNLSHIEVDPANKKYDSRENCNAIIETSTNQLIIGCKDSKFPHDINSIGAYAFRNCVGLTSIEIPGYIKEIGTEAFLECSNLKTVTLSEGLESVGFGAFENCKSLESLEFPSSITSIGAECVKGAENLVSIILKPGITGIGRRAFISCGIKSFVIPNTVVAVGSQAFGWCESLAEIIVPETVKFFEYDAVCNTKVPSITGLDWKEVNQTSITVAPKQEEVMAYFYNGERIEGPVLKVENLEPGESAVIKHGELSCLDKDGHYKSIGGNYGTTTRKIEPYINIKKGYTLSSTEITFRHAEGDAYIQKREYKINGDTYQIKSDPYTITLTDLDPVTTIEYTLTVNMKEYTSTHKLEIPLILDTQSAKAVSNTAAMIGCTTSLSDSCTRAGFEWRRVDAPEIVESSKAPCAILNGEMLGTLHNLSSNTYYQYRPYYQAASGNYYFGEWKGFGTADAYVYFEPIVKTSQASQVTETSALLSGISIAGSDEVIKQGFEYGEYNPEPDKSIMTANPASDNTNIIEVLGTNMLVTVENLQPGTDYWFRAFVTTASGTTYGDTMFFLTAGDKNVSSVNELNTDNRVVEVARYDLQGNRVNRNHSGIHIVVMSDGSVVKQMSIKK